jgi:cobalt-zinc-cadmium efflux system outer membrane protein
MMPKRRLPGSAANCHRVVYGWMALLLVLCFVGETRAQEAVVLPSPLSLATALQVARERRAEIAVSRAQAQAAEQGPAIVYPLEDPSLLPSIDHLPFRMLGADVSVSVEQRFPLSRLRRYRRDAAMATRDRARTAIARTGLDVELDAATAFFMLWEQREMVRIIDQQLGLSRDLVVAANARYGAGTGTQADVLRAEIEVSRLEMQRRVLEWEISADEAMLRAVLGCPQTTEIPALAPWAAPAAPSPSAAIAAAHEQRPELAAGQAEIRGAEAEVRAMRSMYVPMAMLRTGPAYTMFGGPGAMLMFGITLPRRNRVRAQVREAEAMTAMARADLAAMHRMIEGEAASARALVLAADARVVALRDEVVPRSRQAIEPTLAGYAAGKLPLVSVVEAARALWSVEGELIAAQMQLGIAWAQLRRATGGAVRP